MRNFLDFDDAGADDEHPAKGVTVGDIRAWFDDRERLRRQLLRFGRHTDQCPTHGGRDCLCGWENEKAALTAGK